MAEISIKGMAIDLIEICHTEAITIDQKKILTNGGKKQTHSTNQGIFHVVPCVSLSTIGIMIVQIK